MIDPKKKISNPAAGLNPPTNRKPVVTTTVKGSDARGAYTDTNTNQADDSYPGNKPVHTANSWYNGLTQAQKNTHNNAQRAKDLAASKDVTVKGASSTSRVYDPAKVVKPSQPVKPATKSWISTYTNMKFGSHTSKGTTSDPEVIAAGKRKNAVDIKGGPDSNRNTFSSQPYSSVENKLDKLGHLRVSDNPYSAVGDTTGRGANLNTRLAKVESKRSKMGMAKKEEGGKMPMRSMKNMKSKAVVVTKKGAKSSDCGCDGAGKMQMGGSLTATPPAPVSAPVQALPQPKKKGFGHAFLQASKVAFGMAPKALLGPAASMMFPSKAKMLGLPVSPLQMEIGKGLIRGTALEIMQKRKAQSGYKSAQQTVPPINNAPAAEQAIRDAASVQYGTRNPAPMFSRGGGVPDIDEESPIRYR